MAAKRTAKRKAPKRRKTATPKRRKTAAPKRRKTTAKRRKTAAKKTVTRKQACIEVCKLKWARKAAGGKKRR